MHTMNNISRFIVALVALLVWPALSFGQTILNTTTVTAAQTAANAPTTLTFAVGSTANMNASTSYGPRTWLFIPTSGELMSVTSIPVAGTVTVARGVSPTRVMGIAAGATAIIVTDPNALISYNPGGACARGSGLAAFSPVINVANGYVWVCRSNLWQATAYPLVTFNSLEPFTP